MKKLFIVLLIVSLLVATASCKPEEEMKNEKEETTAVIEEKSTKKVEEETKKEMEKVTITFWHNYDQGAGQIATLENLIKEFEAENPDIMVEHLYLEWSALKDNVVSGAATGTLPDVLRGDIAFVPQFQNLNVLTNMSELEDYSDVASKILEAPNSTAKMGDDFYGVAANTNTKIYFYNKGIFREKGLEAPEKLEDVWQLARDVSGDEVVGMVEPWTGIWNVGPYIWSNGGEVLALDYSTAKGYINSDICVDTISLLKELYEEKALAGPSMDPGAIGDTDGWASGVYASQVDGPWRANALNDAGVEYGAMPLPEGSAGSISVLGGEDFMMFKSSDDAHKEASWKFIKFMVSKKAQVEMAKVGQMPVNIEALNDPSVKEAMPLIDVFKVALETAKSRPVTPLWSEMEGIIATKVAEAITGVKDVKVALDEAAEEIDTLISDNK